MVKFKAIQIENPDELNIIIGNTHFIKSVEDIHDAVADSAPEVKFGLAFCEASGPRLIRRAGNESSLIDLAVKNASEVGAGHTFFIIMRNAYPINILPRLKQVPEITTIFTATANPLEVIVAETEQGRGIMGVIDGGPPAGIESKNEERERKDFLRKIGYKS